LFGNDMLVAPVTTPVNRETRLATKTIWLPPGTWIEWSTGAALKGPAKLERTFALTEIPVYVKAGAVVPMQPKMRTTGERPVDPLILTVFPGDSGSTRVYEDEGNTPGYESAQYAWTTVKHSRLPDGTRRIEVSPAEGRYPGMPAARRYEIRLPLTVPPDAVTVNGRDVAYAADARDSAWRYDGSTLTTIIDVPPTALDQRVEVLVKSATVPALVDGVPGQLTRLRTAMDILNTSWPNGWSPDLLIEATQAGRRMTLDPSRARQELEKLQHDMPAIVEAIGASGVECTTVSRALAHLGRAATCVPVVK
jgi:alpha-glucosidase